MLWDSPRGSEHAAPCPNPGNSGRNAVFSYSKFCSWIIKKAQKTPTWRTYIDFRFSDFHEIHCQTPETHQQHKEGLKKSDSHHFNKIRKSWIFTTTAASCPDIGRGCAAKHSSCRVKTYRWMMQAKHGKPRSLKNSKMFLNYHKINFAPQRIFWEEHNEAWKIQLQSRESINNMSPYFGKQRGPTNIHTCHG